MVCSTNLFAGRVVERTKLESAAAEYSYFKGLFGIPVGILFVLFALGNWRWGPLRHTWVFLVCLLLIGAACLAINHFYNESYGRVTLSTRQQARAAVASTLGVLVIVGGSFLARSQADWSLDLPVNPFPATFAAAMLIFYAATVGLRAHHLVILGALLVAGLLPVWHGEDPSNIGLVLAGVAAMAIGVLDHRLLVRNLGLPGALHPGETDAEA